MIEHQQTALKVVKAEAALLSAGGVGQIGVTGLSGTNQPTPGSNVSIIVAPGLGTVADDYGVPLTVSFTIE